ncbi:MAG TPA: hypothetical protein PKA28_10720 [Methylomusa anaerophila]|uniref:Uncharacterized protein n=1 Tax=Methylomusa anaerophila TaxID=1930071 RepID=A0A348AIZ0_9FIRM|nr:hypothetical protein [Methylomusa anaerophila]BBB91038.1 hypothetical protein MAMMFC1_01706 [Methylomusa anaerophila]HML88907.1 hypothetical protein [Methylomusa anaerophila]
MKTKEIESFSEINIPGMGLFIPIIVVYRSPKDYPEKYVARLWDLARPIEIALTRDTLSEIRKEIPLGFVNLGRQENDDPVIVESWV